jgi:aconitate hydratase
MGILPLQFEPGESAASLELTGRETFRIEGLKQMDSSTAPESVDVVADDITFRATVRLDTAREAEYLRHGGILRYVLRELLAT